MKEKFKSLAEFVMAVKQESDSNGKLIDERLELNTELVKSCPNCKPDNIGSINGKLYYCNDCRSFWHI